MPDPITEELFRNAISALGDEMVLTIYRTAYSGVLKNIMDYSAAICDAEGRLVAQGLSPARAICVRSRWRCRRCCSISATTSPRATSSSTTTPMTAACICRISSSSSRCSPTARSIAYAATICHHTDVGGRVPGSNASDSTEIYAEGLRIPPLKLYERGKPNATLFRMIERNVRLPGPRVRRHPQRSSPPARSPRAAWPIWSPVTAPTTCAS